MCVRESDQHVHGRAIHVHGGAQRSDKGGHAPGDAELLDHGAHGHRQGRGGGRCRIGHRHGLAHPSVEGQDRKAETCPLYTTEASDKSEG